MSEEGPPQQRQARTRDVPRNLKPYFLGFLRKGERWNDTNGGLDLQSRQLAFLRARIEAHNYIVAGPVTDGGDVVGFAIIEAATMQDAQTTINEDPGVIAGRLIAEVLPAFLPSLAGIKVEY